MEKNSKLLLSAFRQEKISRAPFWFMRQAGRYLPEYREVRSHTKNFLDMCYTPSKASEVTLQPIRRFGFDASIIFSDILVIPDALGMNVRFEEKKGPVLVPVQTQQELDSLVYNPAKLEPVYEALKLTRAGLPIETTLIGFAGSPWTLACYMVQGQSSKDFQSVRTLAQKDKVFFSRLLKLLTVSVITHTLAQVKAGAEVIQLFDSWSGVLSEQEFSDYVIEPTKQIVAALKQAHPELPIIGFPRMAGTKYKKYALETKVDAISIDSSVELAWAAEHLSRICVVQGNLDPILLAEDKDAMMAQAKKIIATLGQKSFANNRFIFNLGHGILPHTPIDHVVSLCDYLKHEH